MEDGHKRPKTSEKPKSAGQSQRIAPAREEAAAEPPSGEDADDVEGWDEDPVPGSRYESL